MHQELCAIISGIELFSQLFQMPTTGRLETSNYYKPLSLKPMAYLLLVYIWVYEKNLQN